jgi:hypothetical protein
MEILVCMNCKPSWISSEMNKEIKTRKPSLSICPFYLYLSLFPSVCLYVFRSIHHCTSLYFFTLMENHSGLAFGAMFRSLIFGHLSLHFPVTARENGSSIAEDKRRQHSNSYSDIQTQISKPCRCLNLSYIESWFYLRMYISSM